MPPNGESKKEPILAKARGKRWGNRTGAEGQKLQRQPEKLVEIQPKQEPAGKAAGTLQKEGTRAGRPSRASGPSPCTGRGAGTRGGGGHPQTEMDETSGGRRSWRTSSLQLKPLGPACRVELWIFSEKTCVFWPLCWMEAGRQPKRPTFNGGPGNARPTCRALPQVEASRFHSLA